MIVSTFSFAVHMLVSSFRILKPVAEVIELVLPYRKYAQAIMAKSINFNTKHLAKGDPLPPYNGKLRVYNMRYCPYAQRTVLALLAKGLDFEVVNVNLVNKPDWIFEKSPLGGKVPSLEIKENVTIVESQITVEYLDEAYAKRPLLPKDPYKKAQDKILVEAILPGFTSLFYKVIRSPETVTEENVAGYQKALGQLEVELNKRGSKFLFGNEPGYADYMIWPWIERVWLMRETYERLAFDTQKHKRLVEYIEDMLKDSAVAAYLVPKDALIVVMAGYKSNQPNPDYDYLLRK